jgi:UDP-glucose 4-epimerase
MTVLVTGGAGFVGSHLAERLVGEGRMVLVLDSLRKGTTANLQQLLRHDGFELQVGDLRDEAVLKRVADRGPFEAIYHLAAMHYIPECTAHPVETLSVNLVGTQALLDAIPCRRFIFSSTGDVYAQNDGPHREDDSLAPFNIYGLSKVFAERLLEATSEAQKGTTFVIARLFNVYGPRETNPHFIPQLLQEIGRGNPIRVGNLWARRDYTYVADTVEALLALERLDVSTPFEVFNVGTGLTASGDEVVDLLGEILAIRLQTRVDPERVRPVDRPHLQADIGKIHSATGWRPRQSLREGLKQLCMSEGLLR